METLLKLTQQWPWLFLPILAAGLIGIAWAIWRIPGIIARRGLKLKGVEIPAEVHTETKPEPTIEDLQREVTRLREELKYSRQPQVIKIDQSNEGVGAYIRLKPDIEFFGVWNGHDHFDQIQLVSMLWDPKEHTSVGFLKSNILSEFISLIIQKLEEMAHLEIFCLPKQRNVLETYLRQGINDGKITITVRGADSEPD